ncbi:cytochrome c oxidase assembly protein [Rhizobiales bacterium]|uniref:cytochrome c oxidase assembly protein n=1 Tax=Hongsoonwoonella zoysiae TaxID=2821844 RepID=UPI0015603CAE|nr:cytochrome c oxidase assembly protein [Hongsoonwoonella zoysiae]NRG19797.1 cytochrome c oxidase assembly protein [Hongsoonwoonella zoysiae]
MTAGPPLGGNDLRRRNLTVAVVMGGVFVSMVGAAFAAVPLYQLFCQVTGYGGTTQRAEGGAENVIDREITVRFDANVNPKLTWNFKPLQRTVKLKMGETTQIAYIAENVGEIGNVGTSVFNVTPFEAGSYFNKIDCFCFTEQPLKPGESVEMPVVFFIDPAMDEDENLSHVKEITLSYTFYPAEEPDDTVASRPDEDPSNNKL